MPFLNRIVSVPKSTNTSAFRAYMNAILEVTGLMSGQRFPLELFMHHFGTHLKPKESIGIGPVLRKHPDGNYELTDDGYQFFTRRVTVNPMQPGRGTTREEVVENIRKIVARTPDDGWERFEFEYPGNA